MKRVLFLTAALALFLSANGAYAQPSQAQGGGATAPTSNPPAASDATRGTMDKSGMSGTTGGGGAMNSSSNPPSQGKGGPTTGPATK